jgi:hypothetical protein
MEPLADGSANNKKIPLMDLPESARKNSYPDRSYNLRNDHYDSSVNYDKMYGALVQKGDWPLSDTFSAPFAAARINQDTPVSGVNHVSYYPDAN